MFNYFKKRKKNEMVKTDQVTDTVVEEKEILWDDVCSQEEKINDIVINAVQKNLDWILKYRKEAVNLDRIQQLLNEFCPNYTEADINYRQKWGTVPNLMRNTKYKLYIDGDLRLPTWEYDNDTTIINIHLTINNVYCHLDVIIGKGDEKLKVKDFYYSGLEKWFLIVNILNDVNIVNHIREEFEHKHQIEEYQELEELTENLRQSYNESQLILSQLNKSK